MTEKNTLSILQNIKKKMQKFDQEPKKIETVAGINDEFEYIPSNKAKSDVKIEVADNSIAGTAVASDAAASAAAEIDKDLQSAGNPVQTAAKAPTPPTPVSAAPTSFVEDDLGLDDFSDLEDHKPAAPAPKAPPAPAKPQEVVVDDLSLDLEEEDHHQEEPHAEAHDDLDFNLDLDLGEDEEELPQPEPAQQKIPEPEVKKPEEKKTEQQIDDLDLDKLLAEEEAAHKKSQQTAPAKPVAPQPSQEINIDDEEFLKDISMPAKPQAPSPVKAQAPKVEAKKSITDELLDDVDLNDLDDIEDKMFADIAPATTAKAQEKDYSDITAAPQEILQKQLGIKSEEKREEIMIPPLDMSQSFEGERNEEKTYKSPDSNLESMLQNQNFAEIAMHILEPKLDSWLDDHLHGLVEKIVQEEVKKLFEKR